MVSIPLRTETKFNNKLVSKTFTDYLKNTQTNNLILPTLSQIFDLQNPAVAKNEIAYDRYDNKGNIIQFTEKDQIQQLLFGDIIRLCQLQELKEPLTIKFLHI